jgi:hypothetical protein
VKMAEESSGSAFAEAYSAERGERPVSGVLLSSGSGVRIPPGAPALFRSNPDT